MNQIVEKSEGKKYFFLMGCPRSGTTFLARLTGSHPKVAYLEEPHLGNLVSKFHRYLFRLFRVKEAMKQSKIENMASSINVLFQNKQSSQDSERLSDACYKEIRKFLTRILKEHLKEVGKPILLEKTPVNTKYLEELCKCFPNAHVIHSIRDGRDVTSSFFKKDFFTKWNVDLLNQSRIEYCSDLWRTAILDARSFSESLGNRYLEVFYEKLVDDIYGQVGVILDWMDLEWTPEMEQYLEVGMGGFTRRRTGNFRKVLKEDELRYFEIKNRDLMEQLGYNDFLDIVEEKQHVTKS